MKTLLTICLMLFSGMLMAQDIFQESLYSADLVMSNREKISLTDQQAEKIKKIHSQNAGDFSSLKWDLDAATEKLKKFLAESKLDPVAVSKQMDIVLNFENQLKKKQLSTLVAIKNELTEDQQASLNASKNWTVYGTRTNISPTLQSTSPRIRAASGPTVVQGFANKSTVKGATASTISPSNDVLITPDSRTKLFFQLEQELNGNKPTYYLKTKNGLKEFFNFDNIDPKNIESIEVLKDEKATIRFGEKGKNGAIIISLKQTPDELLK